MALVTNNNHVLLSPDKSTATTSHPLARHASKSITHLAAAATQKQPSIINSSSSPSTALKFNGSTQVTAKLLNDNNNTLSPKSSHASFLPNSIANNAKARSRSLFTLNNPSSSVHRSTNGSHTVGGATIHNNGPSTSVTSSQQPPLNVIEGLVPNKEILKLVPLPAISKSVVGLGATLGSLGSLTALYDPHHITKIHDLTGLIKQLETRMDDAMGRLKAWTEEMEMEVVFTSTKQPLGDATATKPIVPTATSNPSRAPSNNQLAPSSRVPSTSMEPPSDGIAAVTTTTHQDSIAVPENVAGHRASLSARRRGSVSKSRQGSIINVAALPPLPVAPSSNNDVANLEQQKQQSSAKEEFAELMRKCQDVTYTIQEEDIDRLAALFSSKSAASQTDAAGGNPSASRQTSQINMTPEEILKQSKRLWVRAIANRQLILEDITCIKEDLTKCQRDLDVLKSPMMLLSSSSQKEPSVIGARTTSGKSSRSKNKSIMSVEERLSLDEELRQLGKPTEGLFDRVPKVIIKRTHNMLDKHWTTKTQFTSEEEGYLEVETGSSLKELLSHGGNALEPVKLLPKQHLNSMHPFSDEDMTLIQHMKARVSYLKNPRYLPGPSVIAAGATSLAEDSKHPIHSHPHAQNNLLAAHPRKFNRASDALTVLLQTDPLTTARTRPPGNGIVAIPSQILFVNYTPHKTYTQTITITNRTPNSARFRLSFALPATYSCYFGVKIKETPGDGGGLVAPGMACKYTVTFTPDSLANYESSLVVATELSAPPSPLPLTAVTTAEATAGTMEPGETRYHQFTVPLLARRDAPELTIPDVLHCGPCREGYIAVRKWSFKNVGGPGRFLILPEESTDGVVSDPNEVFEIRRRLETANAGAGGGGADELEDTSILASKIPDRVVSGPFEISPAFFGVATGESGEITVKVRAEKFFRDQQGIEGGHANEVPCRERLEEVILRVACDNQQVLQLPVRAVVQKPSVSVVSCYAMALDIGKRVGDNIVSDENAYDFGKQNIKAVTRFELTLQNNTRMKLPFRWDLIDNPGRTTKGNLIELAQNDSFGMSPREGFIHANATCTFNFDFSPQRIKMYDVLARFLLLDEDKRIEPSQETTLCLTTLTCKGVGVDYEASISPPILCSPLPLTMGEPWTTRIWLNNKSVSEIDYEWDMSQISPRLVQLSIDTPKECNTVAPGGSAAIDVTFTGQFPCAIDTHVYCKTAGGLGPTLKIPVRVKVLLPLRAIDFAPVKIDFGLLALGEMKTVQVPIVNNLTATPMRLRIKWNDGPRSVYPNEVRSPFHEKEPWSLDVSPVEFVLQGGQTQEITVKYVPYWYQTFGGHLYCEAMVGSEPTDPCVVATALEMVASADTPHVTLLNPINAASCFLGVPFTWTVTLQNTCGLPTTFSWAAPYSSEWAAVFTPFSGEIQGFQSIFVKIELTFFKVRNFDNLEFVCAIDRMVEGNGVLKTRLDVAVHGLCVEVHAEGAGRKKLRREPEKRRKSLAESFIPDAIPHYSRLLFDFGNDCPIFENRTRTLVIRNHSAVATSFRMWVETFTGQDIDENAQEDPASGGRDAVDKMDQVSLPGFTPKLANTKKKPLLKSTKRDKIGFTSESGKAWMESIKTVRETIHKMHQLLREGRGAAFHISPSHGTLEPWQELQITVTSYNNLVGVYEDRAVLEMGSWYRETMPISLGVEGVPLRLLGAQIIKANKNSPWDRMNFGTRLVQLGPRPSSSSSLEDGEAVVVEKELDSRKQAEVAEKVMQVENQSPRTIALIWRVYLKISRGGALSSSSSSTNLPGLGGDTAGGVAGSSLFPLGSRLHTSKMSISDKEKEIEALTSSDYQCDNYLRSSSLAIEAVETSDGSPWYVPDQPEVVLVPAFGTTTMVVKFSPWEAGAYSGVLVADVGYFQPDGSITRNPSMTVHSPIALRQLRLIVSSKVIEPSLVVSEVEGDGRITVYTPPSTAGSNTGRLGCNDELPVLNDQEISLVVPAQETALKSQEAMQESAPTAPMIVTTPPQPQQPVTAPTEGTVSEGQGILRWAPNSAPMATHNSQNGISQTSIGQSAAVKSQEALTPSITSLEVTDGKTGIDAAKSSPLANARLTLRNTVDSLVQFTLCCAGQLRIVNVSWSRGGAAGGAVNGGGLSQPPRLIANAGAPKTAAASVKGSLSRMTSGRHMTGRVSGRNTAGMIELNPQEVIVVFVESRPASSGKANIDEESNILQQQQQEQSKEQPKLIVRFTNGSIQLIPLAISPSISS